MIGALAAALFAAASAGPGDSLVSRIDSLVASVPGAEVAVAFMDLGSGDTLFRDADVVYHAASTMKIPVMMEILRSSEAGRLGLDQEILLVNEFASTRRG